MKRHLQLARQLSKLLDNQFKVLGFKFGLDPILGLLPGLGDIVPAFLSIYIVWIGIKLKLPRPAIIRMIVNVVLDLVLGIVPIAGDVVDFFFKSSQKNLQVLEKHLPNSY